MYGRRGSEKSGKIDDVSYGRPSGSQMEPFGLVNNWNSGLFFDPIFEGFVLAPTISSFCSVNSNVQKPKKLKPYLKFS